MWYDETVNVQKSTGTTTIISVDWNNHESISLMLLWFLFITQEGGEGGRGWIIMVMLQWKNDKMVLWNMWKKPWIPPVLLIY